MKRIGIITDCHSNPWGQEAVLDYLRKEGVDKENTFDLGDLVGMFPRCMETVKIAMGESRYGILGNHDAMLLNYFEDNSKRKERIAALKNNRADLVLAEDSEEILKYLKSLPTSRRVGGISFVHNSIFHTNPYDEKQMHIRFSHVMANPSEKGFDLQESIVSRVSQFCDQIIVRGHAHSAQVYQVKKDLTERISDGVRDLAKPRDGSVSTKGDIWEIDLDPDFKYVLVCASACGANTMFTQDEKLDYRPAGLIVEYDINSQNGKARFFTVVQGYDHQKFIDSVNNDKRWNDEVFEEAKRQIKHLQAGTLLGDR